MNYFELYPGDYRRDTARLSLAEHGAYLLLMADYYGGEQPLPAAYADLYRITGAQGSAEQKAVRSVANNYFPVADDGLRHNSRADREIEKARKRIDTARKNGAKHKPKQNPAGNPVGSSWDTQRVTQSGEALHTPHATSQNLSSGQAPDSWNGTEAGRACRLMREAGCIQSNPSNPDLIAALSEGVTPEALADTVREGLEAGKQKPFAWAIATARSRHAEGARPVSTGPPQKQRTGKTAQGIQILEGLKHEVADAGNFNGLPEAALPRLGSPARS